MKSESTHTNVLGILLNGGQSRRMRTDKGMLSINGLTNVDRVHALLSRCQVTEVITSGQQANSIADLYPQGGPLSGILSVIVKKRPSAVMVVPIDMPLLTSGAINALINQGLAHQKACCYESYSLPVFIPVTDLLIDTITGEFESDRYQQDGKGPSFRYLMSKIGCHYLPAVDSQELINTNTPQEWDNAVKCLQQRT
ncbi:molybdenum cofactor guanylyltransferase [Psychrobium sp. nBUS_13]|uniref:molybdenum cofactor guanylyltransferase n=1 Tax=Psychrobium sp. nBUS_13 TaxID=3395319 RepID=UPI003EBBFAC1